MAGRHDRDRRLDRIDAGELDRDLADARQTLHDRLRRQVRDVERDEVLVRTAAATFVDFGDHGARDDVARGQILGVRRIALHEALAGRVAQDAAFATDAFRDQHARQQRRSGGTARTPCPPSWMPARAAMPRPSPVLMKALVEE